MLWIMATTKSLEDQEMFDSQSYKRQSTVCPAAAPPPSHTTFTRFVFIRPNASSPYASMAFHIIVGQNYTAFNPPDSQVETFVRTCTRLHDT